MQQPQAAASRRTSVVRAESVEQLMPRVGRDRRIFWPSSADPFFFRRMATVNGPRLGTDAAAGM